MIMKMKKPMKKILMKILKESNNDNVWEENEERKK